LRIEAEMQTSLNFPALHASHAGIWLAMPDGDVRSIGKGEAVGRAAETPMIMLNAPLVAQRLGYADLSGLDVLELFAFVYPARFVVPTPKGLASALGISCNDKGISDQEVPQLLMAATQNLLAMLGDSAWSEREGAWDTAQALMRLRWPWAGTVLAELTMPEQAERWLFSRLPEWEEAAPRPAPRTVTLTADAVQERLAALVGNNAEVREGQRAFAGAVAHVFSPRAHKGQPNMLLAEAGTGIGKTLGYLAPASLWSQAADGVVWISTFTKALQRQLVREARRVYPDANDFKTRVVVRKGRENYLCLLNLEDALQGGFTGRAAILAHLAARWAAYSSDGDMIGGDLPGWLPTLFRRNGPAALTDRRGECIYAGCPHYKKCLTRQQRCQYRYRQPRTDDGQRGKRPG
jgi:ATP-dependent DNA helicase DinG